MSRIPPAAHAHHHPTRANSRGRTREPVIYGDRLRDWQGGRNKNLAAFIQSVYRSRNASLDQNLINREPWKKRGRVLNIGAPRRRKLIYTTPNPHHTTGETVARVSSGMRAVRAIRLPRRPSKYHGWGPATHLDRRISTTCRRFSFPLSTEENYRGG